MPLPEIEQHIVGLRRESEVLVTALRTGRHVILEGPPGTGKSTLLRVVAEAFGWGLEFVEGNAELTPARLVGAHDPALVLERGYLPEAFTPGPLVDAMREGSILYVEELNRVPEETLNVLITALAEGEIHVPRLGRIKAEDQFRLIAAMNPFDAIGTARVGQAIYDRMCRVAVGYQDEAAEIAIVERVTGTSGDLVGLSVAVGRATRDHESLRTGSSVRGPIDMVLLARGLADLRTDDPEHPRWDVLHDAALAAFSGRVKVEEGRAETPEEVVTAILQRLLAERDSQGKADAPPAEQDPAAGLQRPGEPNLGGGQPKPASALEGEAAREAIREAGRRTTSRAELASRHPDLAEISPEAGQFDESAFEELMKEDPEAALSLLADLAGATDVNLRALARRAASRIFLRMATQSRQSRRGTRRMAPSRRAEMDGDLDLDRTLERTDGRRPRTREELVVRRFTAAERAVCLMVDRSGSMRGKALAMASLAASAVMLATGERADCSVLAFSDQTIVLQSQGQKRSPVAVVDDLLTLRGKGTTDIANALGVAAIQLGRAGSPDRLAVLMSDCLPTAGADPLTALAGIDRLHVLGTSTDADSLEAGRELARRGGGRHILALKPADVPAAMTALLAS